MYRRYTQGVEGPASHAQVNRNRIKNVIILLLIAALAAACILGIPAIRGRQDERALLIQRMQGECDEAIRQTVLLSRSAGADSTGILAKVRSSVYAIRQANALNSGFGNETLLQEEEILSIQESVDRYIAYLTQGMDTGEYQTNLQNALSALQEKINSLE